MVGIFDMGMESTAVLAGITIPFLMIKRMRTPSLTIDGIPDFLFFLLMVGVGLFEQYHYLGDAGNFEAQNW